MNYTALSTAIQDTCVSTETTFVNNIPNFVRFAEQRIYNLVQIPALRKRATVTVTASSKLCSVPSDFLASFGAALLTSTANVYNELLYRDVDWIREAYNNTLATGVPKYYGLYSDTQFLLGPTPSTTTSIDLHYYYKPTSIVADATSWLGTNYDKVFLYGCLVEAYTFQKGEPELLAQYEKLFQDGLSQLGTVRDNASKVRKV